MNFQGLLILVEVKPGSIGRLRSLHVFMDQAPHGLAVRVWQGSYSVETAQIINGKVFKLINLPFYMVHRIESELANMFSQSLLLYCMENDGFEVLK